jgi:hypothetical protein
MAMKTYSPFQSIVVVAIGFFILLLDFLPDSLPRKAMDAWK